MILKIERDEDEAGLGKFLLLMLARDNVWDILSEHDTRAEALRALKHEREESAADAAAERHYRAQYDHACGY
jgi:hypothetical protein